MAKIGFVGLGVMGSQMVNRLLSKGHTVTGYNRTRTKAQWLVEKGMSWADSPRAVASASDFIFAMVTIFKKTWAPVTAPVYALLEGMVLGSISAMFEVRYHGIAIQAVGLTFGTMFALLVAYQSGLIPVTQNFKLGIVAATGGIALFYIAQIVLGFFGIHFTTINGSGPIGIAFSVFVVIVAALNLVLDFDFIESAARAGAPKYMEWYGAFGLMVTLIWLYLEILRLLSKLRSRD